MKKIASPELSPVIINASGKKLGRVASLAATSLMGKDLVSFRRNEIPNRNVVIENVASLDISERRLADLNYVTYSGYPGGLKKTAGKFALEKKGIPFLFEHAVKGMLPKNRLRQRMLKHLIIIK